MKPNHQGAFTCDRRHMPMRHPEIIRMRRILEIYFQKHLDDFDSEKFRAPYPLGYNASVPFAYYHLAHGEQADILEQAKRLSEDMYVLVFPPNVVESAALTKFFVNQLVEWKKCKPDEVSTWVQYIRTEMHKCDQPGGSMFKRYPAVVKKD
jgi:hypothetical protein